LDSTDVRIFCEMAFRESSYIAFADRRVSPAEIGRKLGLDEKTVRVRVRRMENSGFIKYYQALPNLALFGLRSIGSYRFEALNLSTKFAIVERVHEIPGLVETLDFLGPFLSADVAGASSVDVQEIAKGLAKRYELNLMNLGSGVVREPLHKLDRLDWQVIQKLRYDARSETKEIADAISATPRTVAYRISRLLGSGTVSLRAVIDVQKQEGLIFYELEVAMDEMTHAAAVRSLKEKFGQRIWAMKNPSSNVVLFDLFGFTLGEPEYSVKDTLKIEGVRRCSLFIFKEVIEPRRPSWVDVLIERKISG
jgi:DNA-binding Lrp family transcriptional regulator